MLSTFFRRGSIAGIRPLAVPIRSTSSEPVVYEADAAARLMKRPKRVKVRELKKFKEYFIENLFIGDFEREVLEYPEVIDAEDISAAKRKAAEVQNIITRNVDFQELAGTGKISEAIINHLQDLELFGLKVPATYSGSQLSETENALIFEALGMNFTISRILAENQDSGIQALNLFATKEQKDKYFPNLVNGNSMICFAYSESASVSDATAVQTNAKISDDGTMYELTGQKTWVYNAKSADVMITFGRTAVKTESGDRKPALTAFLIDKNLKGVVVDEPQETIGLRGLEICNVTFDKVVIPAECILGKPNEGLQVLNKLLALGKINFGPSIVGIMKKLINDSIHHCNNMQLTKSTLSHMDFVQNKIGNMTCVLYALESMTYLFAGRLDGFENPDVSLESYIIKIYASEALQFMIKQYLTLHLMKAYKKGNFIENVIKDSLFFLVGEDSNYILKLCIANAGIAHAGKTLCDDIKKFRNPFDHPGKMFQKFLHTRNYFKDEPIYYLKLYEYVHPVLEATSKELEFCVLRLELLAEKLLVFEGTDALKRHKELEVLGEISVLIYALTASLARASRSYCVGLKGAEEEVNIARIIGTHVITKVKAISQFMLDRTLERHYVSIEIGQRTLEGKKYIPEHPTSRNF